MRHETAAHFTRQNEVGGSVARVRTALWLTEREDVLTQLLIDAGRPFHGVKPASWAVCLLSQIGRYPAASCADSAESVFVFEALPATAEIRAGPRAAAHSLS